LMELWDVDKHLYTYNEGVLKQIALRSVQLVLLEELLPQHNSQEKDTFEQIVQS